MSVVSLLSVVSALLDVTPCMYKYRCSRGCDPSLSPSCSCSSFSLDSCVLPPLFFWDERGCASSSIGEYTWWWSSSCVVCEGACPDYRGVSGVVYNILWHWDMRKCIASSTVKVRASVIYLTTITTILLLDFSQDVHIHNILAGTWTCYELARNYMYSNSRGISKTTTQADMPLQLWLIHLSHCMRFPGRDLGRVGGTGGTDPTGHEPASLSQLHHWVVCFVAGSTRNLTSCDAMWCNTWCNGWYDAIWCNAWYNVHVHVHVLASMVVIV